MTDDAANEALARELGQLQARFDSGDLRAFGTEHDSLLRELRTIQKRQAELAISQVKLLGDPQHNATGGGAGGDGEEEEAVKTGSAKEEEALTLLGDELRGILEAVNGVNVLKSRMRPPRS